MPQALTVHSAFKVNVRSQLSQLSKSFSSIDNALPNFVRPFERPGPDGRSPERGKFPLPRIPFSRSPSPKHGGLKVLISAVVTVRFGCLRGCSCSCSCSRPDGTPGELGNGSVSGLMVIGRYVASRAQRRHLLQLSDLPTWSQKSVSTMYHVPISRITCNQRA